MKIENLKLKIYLEQGFSLIEVVLAAAIFMLFSTSAVVVVLGGLNANRLGGEETVANQFATEGIEAVKSIKNQAYTNLVNTAGCSLNRVSNVWVFDSPCATDTLTHNSGDNYIRTIKVESVNRDSVPPAGNIVVSGTNDPDTKKITSTVNWNFNSARPESVALITYLSDWRKAIGSSDNAIIAYSDTVNTPTTPKYRIYTNGSNSFSAEAGTIAGAVGRNFIVRTSPTKREAIVGYVDNAASGVLRIMCYDGTTWSNDWSVTVGGIGTTRRFDIAYETNTGDVMVLYSTNATTNELDYRTKPGTSDCGSGWVDQPAINLSATTGVVSWVKMAWDKRSSSNVIAAVWADLNRDLGVAIWDGSSWTQKATALETTLECAGTCSSPSIPNVQSFDIEFETSSGHIFVVWGSGGDANANGAFYSTCDAPPSCSTWLTKTQIPSMLNDATNLDISANPNDDKIIFASIGDGGSDLQVGYWTGTAWSGNFNDRDASCEALAAGTKQVATGWVISGATVRGIVAYNDNNATTAISYVHLNPSGPTWSTTQTFSVSPTLADPQRWYEIEMDSTNTDTLLLTLSDNALDLHAKKLVIDSTPAFSWSNTNPSGVLEANLSQATISPFGFAYWRNP